MDTEKLRQRRRDDVRLTESGNARSKQLLVMPKESLTYRKWLPGELLSGLQRLHHAMRAVQASLIFHIFEHSDPFKVG